MAESDTDNDFIIKLQQENTLKCNQLSLTYIFVAACMGLFIQICAVGSKRRIFSAPECVLAVQGRSGSSKLDDFGTNRKRVCNFLLILILILVINSNFGPILHHF